MTRRRLNSARSLRRSGIEAGFGPFELRNLRPRKRPKPRDPAKRSGSQKRKDRGRR